MKILPAILWELLFPTFQSRVDETLPVNNDAIQWPKIPPRGIINISSHPVSIHVFAFIEVQVVSLKASLNFVSNKNTAAMLIQQEMNFMLCNPTLLLLITLFMSHEGVQECGIFHRQRNSDLQFVRSSCTLSCSQLLVV